MALDAALSSLDESSKATQIKKVNAIFAFEIKNGSQSENWFIDLKSTGTVGLGKPPKADLSVTVSDADFVLIALGKLNPQKAFSTGKLKVKGNVALATKLEPVLKLGQQSKL